MSTESARYRVEERAAQPYAYVSDDSVYMDRFDVIADRFGEVFAWLGQRGIEPVGPVFFKYNVINMPGPMHLEAGVPIAETVEGDDAVSTSSLPAGRYVTVRHHGHPDSLMQATAGSAGLGRGSRVSEFDQEDTPAGSQPGSAGPSGTTPTRSRSPT